MRPLTDEEMRVFFEKLRVFIGASITRLIDRHDAPHTFRCADNDHTTLITRPCAYIPSMHACIIIIICAIVLATLPSLRLNFRVRLYIFRIINNRVYYVSDAQLKLASNIGTPTLLHNTPNLTCLTDQSH